MDKKDANLKSNIESWMDEGVISNFLLKTLNDLEMCQLCGGNSRKVSFHCDNFQLHFSLLITELCRFQLVMQAINKVIEK